MFRGHRDLKVFQLAYRLAMEIFHLTKSFPKEERYSLTDQIRRSSRSVAANLTFRVPALDFPAILHRLIHRYFVNVFQIAADGHAHRNTCNS